MGELPDILRRIVDRRRHRIDRWRRSEAPLEGPRGERRTAPSTARFLDALKSVDGRAIIAEIKMGSPRLGSLVGRLDPGVQAKTYARHGAAALSVVVEPDFFFGSYELLERCRRASGLATLAKDFVIDPIQVEWARRAGADAVLLIAALVPADELRNLGGTVRRGGMVPLVECHTARDVEKLVDADWELVGINSRSLRTFEVDLRRPLNLAGRLPSSAVKIAESGIATVDDVARLAGAGFSAFLVGESLLLATEPGTKLEELAGRGRVAE